MSNVGDPGNWRESLGLNGGAVPPPVINDPDTEEIPVVNVGRGHKAMPNGSTSTSGQRSGDDSVKAAIKQTLGPSVLITGSPSLRAVVTGVYALVGMIFFQMFHIPAGYAYVLSYTAIFTQTNPKTSNMRKVRWVVILFLMFILLCWAF